MINYRLLVVKNPQSARPAHHMYLFTQELYVKQTLIQFAINCFSFVFIFSVRRTEFSRGCGYKSSNFEQRVNRTNLKFQAKKCMKTKTGGIGRIPQIRNKYPAEIGQANNSNK